MKCGLYDHAFSVNSKITIKVPTLREIVDSDGGMDSYYAKASMLTCTPTDMMIELDDIGVNYAEVSDFELFCTLFEQLKNEDLSLFFPDIDFTNCTAIQKQDTGEFAIYDVKAGCNIIDILIHEKICDGIRYMLSLEKNEDIPANEEAREYLLKKARRKRRNAMRRAERQKTEPMSQFEKYVTALVCAPELTYTYDSILDMTIFQFNAALQQVIRRVDYDKLMIGCYAGTVDAKTMDRNRLTWIMT